MTLPVSGPISLGDIAAEFGLPATSVFPTAFYGLGGAPASGPLGFHDFYGRSGAMPISTNKSGINATGFSASDTATITASGGRTITSITLIAGATGGRVTLGGTGGTNTTITVSTPGSGNGTVSGIYRVQCSTGETVDVSFSADWGTA